jgi:hypothetical protein
MTEILPLACFVTGAITAWLVQSILVTARMSWSQERMQRKVEGWQEEAEYWRRKAERCEDRLDLLDPDPERPDWPPDGTE